MAMKNSGFTYFKKIISYILIPPLLILYFIQRLNISDYLDFVGDAFNFTRNTKSLYWYEKAALNGSTEAAFKLGTIYREGMDSADHIKVPVNYAEAIKWYKIGSSHYSYPFLSTSRHIRHQKKYQAYCFNNLGVMYSHGEGVAKDHKKALQFFLQASALGNNVSNYALGLYYEYGNVVKQDYMLAAQYYQKAAIKNIKWAQNDLASLYASGKGVTQNDEQAALWFRRAAEHAYEFPEIDNVFNIYNPDLINAYVKYKLATIGTSPQDRSLRKNLNQQLTAEQREFAQRLSQAFEKQRQP